MIHFSYDNWFTKRFVTRLKWIWQVVSTVPWLRSRVNRLIINNLVKHGERRPHPLSLWGPIPKSPDEKSWVSEDYVSWTGLVERCFTGRHTPPASIENLPSVDKVAALFQRRGEIIPCPKSTALFGFFAQWFTDSFLRTDPDDPRFNTSNHEIDLCQIYGLTASDTRILRDIPTDPRDPGHPRGRLRTNDEKGFEDFPPFLFDKDGGRVREEFQCLSYINPKTCTYRWDVFGDQEFNTPDRRRRLFATGLERGNSTIFYSAINTIFFREHNRIAGLIAAGHPDWDDDRVFETARNVNIAQLLHIIVEDYINHISPVQFRNFVELEFAEKQPWYRHNRICAEFNLLYRWHQLVPTQLSMGGRPLGGKDFRFNNDLLASEGIEAVIEAAALQGAGRIGLHNSASFLEKADSAALKKSRQWRIASYTDYRKAFRLKPVRSFLALTGDAVLASELENIYIDVDKVELVTGLFAEERIPGTMIGDLMTVMVAVDAFSQALTNPLLAWRIYGENAFSREGMAIIGARRDHSFAEVFRRNTTKPVGPVSFSQKRIPGGWRIPWLGNVVDTFDFSFISGWERFLGRRREKHGSTVFRANITQPAIVMLDQRAIASLFQSRGFDPDPPKDHFQFQVPPLPLLGGVVPAMFESGAKHDVPKAVFLDLIKRRSRTLVGAFDDVFGRFAAQWEAEPFGFTREIERFAAAFAFEWILGESPEDTDPVRKFFEEMFLPCNGAGLRHLPGSGYARRRRQHAEFVEFVKQSPNFGEIRQLAQAIDGDDVVAKLLAYFLGNNMYLGIQNLLKSVVGELGARPALVASLRKELDAIAKPGTREPVALDALGSCRLLDNVLREILRLHPPVFFILGRANRDLVIESDSGAIPFRKGELAMGVIPFAQRDPAVFDRPDDFDPARFDAKDDERHPSRHLIWPRGLHDAAVANDDRTCPGKDVAVWIAKLFCHRLLTQFDWELEDTAPRWGKRLFVLNVAAPVGPLRVKRFQRRKAGPLKDIGPDAPGRPEAP